MFHEKKKYMKIVEQSCQKLFVSAVGEIRQSFIFLGGARRLALDLPAFPCIQTAALENFLSALNVVFNVIIKKI
jgi:hypothetical protein